MHLRPVLNKRIPPSSLLLTIASLLLIGTGNLVAQYPKNPRTIPEYAPVEAVWIEWNFDPATWTIYSALINEVQEAAKAYLIVPDSLHEAYLRGLLINDSIPLENVFFFQTPTERIWIRDHGPITITDAADLAYLDFDDYANSGVDENLPTRLAQLIGIDSYEIDLIYDGGNVMVDNHNNLFCTKRLYTRNPSLTQDSIKQILHAYMGIDSVHALCALANDYWGHIDMQMKLLDDTTVVISYYDPYHPSHDSTESNFQYMQSLTNPYGGSYRIARLPTSGSLSNYANSLIVNNKIIMPSYDHPNDTIAMQIYQTLLPGHEIVSINSNTLIAWQGAIHCIAMQHPYNPTAILEHGSSIRQKLFLAPNPARNTLFIESDDLTCSMRIINTLGAVVMESETRDRTTVLNIESLNQGIYFLLLEDHNGSATFKTFVKID